jgi:tRNA pseudouridine38-40 synthase
MRHVRLVVEYDGTEYAGFQIQPERPTVQGVLEQALQELLGRRHRIHAASRTDAGVHACGQVVSFTTEHAIPLERIGQALNEHLPADVVVTAADEAPPGFHPRFQARCKQYRYRLLARPLPSAFLGRHAWHLQQPVDVAAMQQAAATLVGKHDFAAFCASGSAVRNTVREIYELTVRPAGEIIEIDVRGNGFLYMMVRIIVGTLVEVGRGRMAPEQMAAILQSRDRRQAGPTAPARGR